MMILSSKSENGSDAKGRSRSSRGVSTASVCPQSPQKSREDETPGGNSLGAPGGRLCSPRCPPEQGRPGAPARPTAVFPLSQLAKSEGCGVRLPGLESSGSP